MKQTQLINAMRVAINERVEQAARERGYNGAESLASYINSGVPTWASEAQVFVAWRDQVWVETLEMMAKVESGEIPIPTMSQALNSIPPINWPEV